MSNLFFRAVTVCAFIIVLALTFSLGAVEEKKADEKATATDTKPNTDADKKGTEAKESPILATVNGVPIKTDEVERLYGHLEGKTPRSFILNQLIQKKAVEQFLDKENAKVDEKLVDQDIENIKKVYEKKNFDLEKKMKEQGITAEEFRKEIAFQVRLREYLNSKTTDEEIVKELSAVRASHILISTTTGLKDEDAKKKIEEIEAELRKAPKLADAFAEAAGKYSDCPSKAQGGDLDFFPRQKMVKEFADAAFSLEVGQMSAPVKTKFGYHLILVTDRKPFPKDQFEKDKEKIRAQYVQMKIMPFVTEILEKAKVERFDTALLEKEDAEKATKDKPVEKSDEKGSGETKEPVKQDDKPGAGGEK
jgi:parvulin-like peptidyl-prolyl isomerase